MNQSEIKRQVIDLCASIFSNFESDKEALVMMDFNDDLEMDSITFITMIIEIETAYDITIPDEMLFVEQFKNVDSIVDVICNLLTEHMDQS